MATSGGVVDSGVDADVERRSRVATLRGDVDDNVEAEVDNDADGDVAWRRLMTEDDLDDDVVYWVDYYVEDDVDDYVDDDICL